MSDVRKAKKESFSPAPSGLTDERAWFVPALAYCMMGMDASLFSLFSAHAERDIDVVTHQSQEPLFELEHADAKRYLWFGVVQGIPKSLERIFIDYVQSYVFKEQTAVGETIEWKLSACPIRMADPFARGELRAGVDVWFFLPTNVTRKSHVVVTRRPGLALLTPVLGVRPVGE